MLLKNEMEETKMQIYNKSIIHPQPQQQLPWLSSFNIS